MVSAAVVAGSRHHACTNQGTVKRLGSTAKGKNAKYTGVLSLTHTRELAVAPIGYPVAGTRESISNALGAITGPPSDHGWYEVGSPQRPWLVRERFTVRHREMETR